MRAASLLLLCSTPVWAAQGGKPMTCAKCHREQAQSQPLTPMGIGMQLPPNQPVLAAHPKMTLEKAGYRYTVETTAGQSTYTVTDGKSTLTLPIHYAFGVDIQTYVLEQNGRFFESLVSYYPTVGGLALTMGDERLQPHTLQEAMGRETTTQEIKACFGCHATGAVKEDHLSLDTLTPGLTCEHCHAGGEAHMDALAHGQTAAPPKKLGGLAAEDMSSFCGGCHRTWETVVRTRKWGELNVRFQPYRLANSRCFNGADARIACTACHDPHRNLVRNDASYDNSCLACHAATTAAAKQCSVAKTNCVSCHMPKVELPGSHAIFTDHQIRIVRAKQPYPN